MDEHGEAFVGGGDVGSGGVQVGEEMGMRGCGALLEGCYIGCGGEPTFGVGVCGRGGGCGSVGGTELEECLPQRGAVGFGLFEAIHQGVDFFGEESLLECVNAALLAYVAPGKEEEEQQQNADDGPEGLSELHFALLELECVCFLLGSHVYDVADEAALGGCGVCLGCFAGEGCGVLFYFGWVVEL